MRFIPTYVGHTPLRVVSVSPFAVHPHIRGAYFSNDDAVRELDGSSPHTWGIPLILYHIIKNLRFIPTYVGHTLDRRKENGWFQPLLL